jgi:biopolymer transport protein ExbD
MARRSILSEEEPAEIDLSSMIACLFLILAFFIVATVFVEEQGLEVNKPDAAASTPLQEATDVTLEITADNKILFDNERVRLAEVSGRVKAAVEDPETAVTIRAHEKSDHGTFVSVWDAAKRGGAENLRFSTVN